MNEQHQVHLFKMAMRFLQLLQEQRVQPVTGSTLAVREGAACQQPVKTPRHVGTAKLHDKSRGGL